MGPIPAATAPADILGCSLETADLTRNGERTYACGGLEVGERCERDTRLYDGVVNELVCHRTIDRRQHDDNSALTARALFWRDAGCPLAGSSVREDTDAVPFYPVERGGRVRLLVEGCGQQRRYACKELPANALGAVMPECEAAPPEITAFVDAIGDARAVVHQANHCPLASIALLPYGAGPQPERGIVELIFEGCGAVVPVTCALTPHPTPRYAGDCSVAAPSADVLARAEQSALRAYVQAAGCEGREQAAHVSAGPVSFDPKTGFSRMFDGEGCPSRGRVRCVAQGAPPRDMHCAAERLAASDAVLGRAAREVAAARSPGCRFDEGWHWGGAELYARVLARGTCAGGPTEVALRCDAAPGTGAPRCAVDPPFQRVGEEGRAIVVARFAKATGCPAADTSVTEHRSHLFNGRFVTALRVTGCKESTYYECQRGPAPDDPPVCR